jgi:hypothetical protein
LLNIKTKKTEKKPTKNRQKINKKKMEIIAPLYSYRMNNLFTSSQETKQKFQELSNQVHQSYNDYHRDQSKELKEKYRESKKTILDFFMDVIITWDGARAVPLEENLPDLVSMVD